MKKKVVIIIISIIVVLAIAAALLIPYLIKKQIEKEKQQVLKNTNELVKVIKTTCENEEEKTLKYVVGEESFKSIKVETLPDSGIIELNDTCEVTLSLIYGDYSVIKKSNKDAKIIDDNVIENGTVVYFNPETKEVCKDYEEDNSKTGDVKGCMKWYVFNDKEKETSVSLILDHNTTQNISYVKANDKLQSDTSSWIVESRLLEVDEVGKVIDTKIDKGSTNFYFFDSKQDRPIKTCYNKNVEDCHYGWLYDRTSTTCKDYGCLTNTEEETYGYWTNTINKKDETLAWRVYFDGRVLSTNINDVSSGIRPVISLQKSIIK